jgi:hypothetical protein
MLLGYNSLTPIDQLCNKISKPMSNFKNIFVEISWFSKFVMFTLVCTGTVHTSIEKYFVSIGNRTVITS